MRRYLAITLTLVGVLVLIVSIVSWFLFPSWRKIPYSPLLLLVAALGGVLLAFSGFKDTLELITTLLSGKKQGAPPGPALNVQDGVRQTGETNVTAANVQADQIGGMRIEHAEQVVIGESPAATHELREIKSLLIDAASLGQLGPREWLRPTAPRPSRPMVGRVDEFNTVSKLLNPGAKAAITATVQGTPGVGKTLLAEHLAAELDSQFAGGVLFERFGVGFRDPALTAPILDRWGAHAFGRRLMPEGAHFTPDAVRDLLSGHGHLLAVLDDIWDLKAITPLLDALPNDACVLVTTRSAKLGRDLRGEVYPLDVLSIDDALKLLRARLPQATDADDDLLKKLAEALGRHAQALDIAGGSLAPWSRARWAEAAAAMARQVREGSGFGELHLPGEEEAESRVEAALYVSYTDLAETAQARFRKLGAFAPDASFRLEAAAGLWDCKPHEAEGQLILFAERSLLTRIDLAPRPPSLSGKGEIDTPPRFGERPGVRWQQHSLLRAYALALLRREGEEEKGRERHAAVHNALMRDADDRQIHYLMLPDYPQLRHAFEWAIAHNLSLAQALAGNTANLQAGFNLVRDSYTWASQIAALAREAGDQAALGRALVTLGNALSRVGTLPNEDRRARLLAALAACDEALQHYRPDTAPLDYAATQNNRATLLSDIANLPGEDRRARLLAALAAYDEALQHYRPDTAPLDYAMTQNNRATLLSDIANLPGEDRRARLLAALAAYDEALQHYRPDTAPLAYAMTQNNRATLLSAIANLPGEDRRARLLAALAAYDEALQHYRPDTAPLAYAMTQNNRATLLSDIANLPGEDRRARLLAALAAYDEALQHYRPDTAPLAYAMTQNNRATLLSDIANLPGEDRRARLLAALAAYDEALQYRRPDTAPLDYAMTQGGLALLLVQFATLLGEDRRAHLREALRCTHTALLICEQVGHAPFAQKAAGQLREISAEAGELFPELWTELNVGEPPEWLTANLKLALLPESLRAALTGYVETRRRAEEEKSVEAWQAAARAGEQVLNHPEAAQLPLSLDELRAEVASCWNSLGYILSDEQKKPTEALAAFGEAIRFQPNFAMYHRNHASTNTDLGHFDAAEADLARAAELEPDHPRLAELRKELEEARKKAGGA